MLKIYFSVDSYDLDPIASESFHYQALPLSVHQPLEQKCFEKLTDMTDMKKKRGNKE